MIKYSNGVGIVKISGLTNIDKKKEVTYLILDLAVKLLM